MKQKKRVIIAEFICIIMVAAAMMMGCGNGQNLEKNETETLITGDAEVVEEIENTEEMEEDSIAEETENDTETKTSKTEVVPETVYVGEYLEQVTIYYGEESIYYGKEGEEKECKVLLPRAEEDDEIKLEKTLAYSDRSGISIMISTRRIHEKSSSYVEERAQWIQEYFEDDEIQNYKQSEMLPLANQEDAGYLTISFERKLIDEMVQKGYVLAYCALDISNCLVIEIELNDYDYDENTDKILQELEEAYGFDLHIFYQDKELMPEENISLETEGIVFEKKKTPSPGIAFEEEYQFLTPVTISYEYNDDRWEYEIIAPDCETLTVENGKVTAVVSGMKTEITIDRYSSSKDWKMQGAINYYTEYDENTDTILKELEKAYGFDLQKCYSRNFR